MLVAWHKNVLTSDTVHLYHADLLAGVLRKNEDVSYAVGAMLAISAIAWVESAEDCALVLNVDPTHTSK